MKGRGAGPLLATAACALLLAVLSACAHAPDRPITIALQPQPATTLGSSAASPQKSSAASTQPLVLVETAYWWIPDNTPYPFNAAVDYTFVVKNPNLAVGAMSAPLRITMRDKAGTPFYVAYSDVGPIRPGQTIVGGSQEYPTAKPASVEFELLTSEGLWEPADRWKPVDFKPLAVGSLTLHQSSGKPPADLVGYPAGYSYFTGVVRNPNSVGFDALTIDLLRRDTGGRIVAHYDDFSTARDGVRARGQVAFRLNAPDKLPQSDTYEAYARPWYESGPAAALNVTAGP